MKPVVLYARSLFEIALLVVRIRAATRDAIDATGAARITIEPATPGAVNQSMPQPRPRTPRALAAARSSA